MKYFNYITYILITNYYVARALTNLDVKYVLTSHLQWPKEGRKLFVGFVAYFLGSAIFLICLGSVTLFMNSFLFPFIVQDQVFCVSKKPPAARPGVFYLPISRKMN